MGIISGIATGLGHIIAFIYKYVQNYGVAIIIFTLLVRLLLLPLNIKQQRSMLRMKAINPLLQKIQTKYKDDKEKLNQETMKLYKEYNINPMAGCLPLLIQLPILLALIRVIYDPARFMFGADTSGIRDIMSKLNLAVNEYGLKRTFLGIDLISIPDFKFVSVLWIFPLLATAATYLSGKMAQKTQGGTNTGNDAASQTSNMMTSIFPIMTLFFTFTMPVAASFYWFISSAIQIVQTYALNKIIKVDDISIDDGGNWHERNNKKRKNG
ncbi:MAG: YidC/Oxa1 family membrane protein insertase [Clostridia bacterium]|nr:YidC/Oxa1 family membrane protein insertase [Clostridia bacterium]